MSNYQPPDDEQRCTGTSKQQGRRCIRYAQPGANVCYFHGGASPQVKSVTDKLFGLAADRALEVLVDEMDQAESSRDRIRAALGVLDRAGFGVLRRVEITTASLVAELDRLNREIAVMDDEEAEGEG